VTWDDNARSKGSKFGPCISDISLMVQNRLLPMIRLPNYEDVTWDIPMEKIPLVVGNELDGKLYSVTLKYYLENFRMFLSKSADWKGGKDSLSTDRETHAVCSAQACILPIPQGSEATFNLGILNYQSRAKKPAILALVASSTGTSAQVVECDTFSGTQKLYFNSKGQKASFVAHRLSDNRRERGVAVEGKMSAEEKEKNMLMLIQIPLKYEVPAPRLRPRPRPRPRRVWGYRYKKAYLGCDDDGRVPEGGGDSDGDYYDEEDALAQALPAKEAKADRRRSSSSSSKAEKADLEEAVVSVGKDEGPFSECSGLAIERDPKFPVRVTFQFYRSTSNGIVEESHMKAIAAQIKESQKDADFLGSLVVKRPTEPKKG